MQEGKNPSFVEIFGLNALHVVMGDYTLMPDGVLKRVNHPDQPYREVKFDQSSRRLIVIDTHGAEVVVEHATAVKPVYEGDEGVGAPAELQAEPNPGDPAPSSEPETQMLFGSSVQPATLPDLQVEVVAAVGGQEQPPSLESLVSFVVPGDAGSMHHVLQLGDVVAAAHKRSGLTVEQWNGQPEEVREDAIRAELELLYAAAREKSEPEEKMEPGGDAPVAGAEQEGAEGFES